MKILLFTNSYTPKIGGLEIAVSHLAKTLALKGHHVEVIAGTDRLCMTSGREAGAMVHRVPFVLPRILSRLGWQKLLASCAATFSFLFFFPLVTLRIISIYQRFRPDVVNLHYIGNNSFYALLLKKLFPFPFIVNIHGSDILGVKRRPGMARRLTVATLKNADLILSNSRMMIEERKKVTDDIKAGSGVVPNGINLETFPSVRAASGTKAYLVAIGNFAFNKGHDVLIRAYRHLKETAPSSVPDLVIVGDGPELNKCRMLARDFSLEQHIRFEGRLSQEKTLSLLKGSEFLVHGAREEAFGLVLLEAMALGKAIVSTNVGGIGEVARADENALLVESESPEALAGGIRKLLGDPALRQKFEKKSLEIVQGYRWDKVTDQYISFYEHVIEEGRCV